MRENARLVLYRVEALSAPLGACTGGLADRTEWQRRQYVRGGLRRPLGALRLPRRLPGVEEHFAFCACRDGAGSLSPQPLCVRCGKVTPVFRRSTSWC